MRVRAATLPAEELSMRHISGTPIALLCLFAVALSPSALVAQARQPFDEGVVLSREGAHVATAAGEVVIGLTALGREGELQPIDRRVAPVLEGRDATFSHGSGITEWWRRRDDDAEQGVTLLERPAGSGDLVLRMSVRGAVAEGGEVIRFTHGDVVVATYTGLVAYDAGGRRLPARMLGVGASIEIEVDDEGAQYPVVVDPIVATTEATILGALPTRATSVSVAADGTRAFIEGVTAADSVVLARTGTTWAVESTNLDGPGSISADGVRICHASDGIGGRVEVHVRSGSTWSLEATLVASAPSRRWVRGCALSSDGSVAIVGLPNSSVTSAPSDIGEARVFRRSGSTWGTGEVIRPADAESADYFGWTVSISGDGSRVAVAARDDAATGTVRVASDSGTRWTFVATVTPDADAVDFGTMLAISGDGRRVAASGTLSTSRIVVSREDDSGAWAREAVLTPSTFPIASISMSAQGDRVAMTHIPGVVEVFDRVGSTWSAASAIATFSAGSEGNAAAGISGDGVRVVYGRTSTVVYRLAGADGAGCSAGAGCSSGFCVDGACCESACAGGSGDCRACSVPAGGTANGTCTALSGARAPLQVCRASAGLCDVTETCAAGMTACPPDMFVAEGTECHAASPLLACDRAETCTGTTAGCPIDRPQPDGVTCRTARGDCDRAEQCDGSSFDCPTDERLSMFTECRESLGVCDQAETCTGSGDDCPPDTFVPAGTLCGPAAVGPCDVDDVCNGTSAACPTQFRESGEPCGPAPAGPCDLQDTCTGASGECLPAYLSAVSCRPAAGACDVEELCLGDSPDCPPDSRLAAEVVCRAPADVSCDTPEVCDGASSTCPADVTECAAVDAGRPDAAVDASSPDGGVAPPAAASCSCTAGTRGPSWACVMVALLLAAARWHRRRCQQVGVTRAGIRA